MALQLLEASLKRGYRLLFFAVKGFCIICSLVQMNYCDLMHRVVSKCHAFITIAYNRSHVHLKSAKLLIEWEIIDTTAIKVSHELEIKMTG